MAKSKKSRIVRGWVELLEERRLLAAYAITDLGTLGGATSHAFAANASGQVVGDSLTAGGATHAFLYAGGMMTDLGTLGGTTSHAFAINDAGQIVGDSTDAAGQTHAFLYAGGVMSDLGTLGGGTSSAQGINASGEIVGYSQTPSGQPHAFSENSGGAMTDLDTLGGTSSFAYNVNASGQIVGYSTLPSGDERAFLYSGGVMKNLGTLGGSQSIAFHGINDAGTVAGGSPTNNTDPAFHAFLYTGSASLSDIGTVASGDTFAYAINNSGQVVGKSLVPASGSNYDAYVYTNGVMFDLNGQIDAASGWQLSTAQGTNVSGQIVGTGVLGGNEHAFLLTPTGSIVGGGGGGNGGGGAGGGATSGVLTPVIGKATVPTAVISGKAVRGIVAVNLINSSNTTIKGLATVKLLASIDNIVDPGDTTVATLKKKVNLKPHHSVTFVLSIKSLPAGIPSRTYALLAQAIDSSGNTQSTNDGPLITTVAPFVALAEVVGVTSPATIEPGKSGIVSITLTNSGNIDTTGKATIEVGGSSDGLTEAVSFGTQQIPLKVKAHGKLAVRLKLKIPSSNSSAGPYHVFVRVSQNGSTVTGIGSGLVA